MESDSVEQDGIQNARWHTIALRDGRRNSRMQIKFIGGPADGAIYGVDAEQLKIGDRYYFCCTPPIMLTREAGEQARMPVVIYEIDQIYPHATARLSCKVGDAA